MVARIDTSTSRYVISLQEGKGDAQVVSDHAPLLGHQTSGFILDFMISNKYDAVYKLSKMNEFDEDKDLRSKG